MNPRGYLSGSLPYSHEAHGIVHSGEYWHQTAYGFQAAPRQTVPSMEHAYPSSYSVEHAALPGNANSNYIATPTGFSQFVGSCLSENVPPGPTDTADPLPPLPPGPAPGQEPLSSVLQSREESPPPPLPPDPPPMLELASGPVQPVQVPYSHGTAPLGGQARAPYVGGASALWGGGAPPLPPDNPPDVSQPPLPPEAEELASCRGDEPGQQGSMFTGTTSNVGATHHQPMGIAGTQHSDRWFPGHHETINHASSLQYHQGEYGGIPHQYTQHAYTGLDSHPAVWPVEGRYTSHVAPSILQQSYGYVDLQHGPVVPWGDQASAILAGPDAAHRVAAEAVDHKPVVDFDIVDACRLFLPPGRAKRPQHMCIILRGLPGSGKSVIAKKFRDMEVQHGGEAPRLHALDDYFITEVEKEAEEVDARGGKRKRVEREMEYCYEAELEEPYKKSLSKAVKKSLEERRYRVVVMDAPNAQIKDFQDIWTAAQRAGYEVYVLQPMEGDPEVCFSRNVHGRRKEDISAMAAAWEECPPLYTLLDVARLMSGGDLPSEGKACGGITEVDMEDDSDDGPAEAAQEDEASDGVAFLKTSRWALLDENIRKEATPKRSKSGGAVRSPTDATAAKGKDAGRASRTGAKKRVRWPDEVVHVGGFSIGGASRQQLETVYVLEGLGPSRDLPNGSNGSTLHMSFADQLKADRLSEQQAFRNILLGGLR